MMMIKNGREEKGGLVDGRRLMERVGEAADIEAERQKQIEETPSC